MLDYLWYVLKDIIGYPEEIASVQDQEMLICADLLMIAISGVIVCLTISFLFKFLLKLVER